MNPFCDKDLRFLSNFSQVLCLATWTETSMKVKFKSQRDAFTKCHHHCDATFPSSLQCAGGSAANRTSTTCAARTSASPAHLLPSAGTGWGHFGQGAPWSQPGAHYHWADPCLHTPHAALFLLVTCHSRYTLLPRHASWCSCTCVSFKCTSSAISHIIGELKEHLLIRRFVVETSGAFQS